MPQDDLQANMAAGPAAVSTGQGVLLSQADEGFAFDGQEPSAAEVLADHTGGEEEAAAVSTVGVYDLSIPIDLASIAGAGDVVTNILIGCKFKVLSVDFHVTKIVTTAAKAAQLYLDIPVI